MFARKIIICIFLLVLPRTVEAVSYKELSRIKQNFSVILVPSDTDPFHLKSILSSIVSSTFPPVEKPESFFTVSVSFSKPVISRIASTLPS